jgi:hypothetical protein
MYNSNFYLERDFPFFISISNDAPVMDRGDPRFTGEQYLKACVCLSLASHLQQLKPFLLTFYKIFRRDYTGPPGPLRFRRKQISKKVASFLVQIQKKDRKNGPTVACHCGATPHSKRDV